MKANPAPNPPVPPDFPMVYRNNLPAGLKGRRCRIVDWGGRTFWGNGALVVQSGDNEVTVEFEDGARITARRSAVVGIRCRMGRAALALGASL